jgi:ADP-ribose pyrophosphatase YjhB (NUDIX family)
MKIPLSVCCILHENYHVYLSRRIEPPRFKHFWQCPGGKAEKGEDAFVAAHRELCEETGLKIYISRFNHLLDHVGDPTSRVHTVFAIRLLGNEIPRMVEPDTTDSDWIRVPVNLVFQLKLKVMPGIKEGLVILYPQLVEYL